MENCWKDLLWFDLDDFGANLRAVDRYQDVMVESLGVFRTIKGSASTSGDYVTNAVSKTLDISMDMSSEDIGHIVLFH